MIRILNAVILLICFHGCYFGVENGPSIIAVEKNSILLNGEKIDLHMNSNSIDRLASALGYKQDYEIRTRIKSSWQWINFDAAGVTIEHSRQSPPFRLFFLLQDNAKEGHAAKAWTGNFKVNGTDMIKDGQLVANLNELGYQEQKPNEKKNIVWRTHETGGFIICFEYRDDELKAFSFELGVAEK
jgi:hypothetical protein